MTGIATAIYESEARERTCNIRRVSRVLQASVAGCRRLSGTHPFTLERSVKAYRLNKFLHSLI